MSTDSPPLRFRYRNYKGEVAWRVAEPLAPWYGSTEHHPQEQWFWRMRALDRGGQERDFAVADILEFAGPDGRPREGPCPFCSGTTFVADGDGGRAWCSECAPTSQQKTPCPQEGEP